MSACSSFFTRPTSFPTTRSTDQHNSLVTSNPRPYFLTLLLSLSLGSTGQPTQRHYTCSLPPTSPHRPPSPPLNPTADCFCLCRAAACDPHRVLLSLFLTEPLPLSATHPTLPPSSPLLALRYPTTTTTTILLRLTATMSSVRSRRCPICHLLNAPCLLREVVKVGKATFSCSVCHHQFGSSSTNGHNHMRDIHGVDDVCVKDVNTGRFTHRKHRPVDVQPPQAATPLPQPLKTKKRKTVDAAATSPPPSPPSPFSRSSTLSVDTSLPSLPSSWYPTQHAPSIFTSPVNSASPSDDEEVSVIHSLPVSNEAWNDDGSYDALADNWSRTPLLDGDMAYSVNIDWAQWSEAELLDIMKSFDNQP